MGVRAMTTDSEAEHGWRVSARAHGREYVGLLRGRRADGAISLQLDGGAFVLLEDGVYADLRDARYVCTTCGDRVNVLNTGECAPCVRRAAAEQRRTEGVANVERARCETAGHGDRAATRRRDGFFCGECVIQHGYVPMLGNGEAARLERTPRLICVMRDTGPCEGRVAVRRPMNERLCARHGGRMPS